MKLRPLTGTITALATPFRDGQVSYEDLKKLVAHQIKGGINGLVPVGAVAEWGPFVWVHLEPPREPLEAFLDPLPAWVESRKAFAGLEYIASAGLGALISLHQTVTQRQGQLRVAGLTGMVRSAVETTGLASTFRLYPDLNEALRGLPGRPTP